MSLTYLRQYIVPWNAQRLVDEMLDESVNDSDYLEDVRAFVAEKWQRNPCDRCGSFEWSILPGKASVVSVNAYGRQIMDEEVMAGRRSPPSRYEYEIQFIPIYCNNCGNTVNILRQVFEEWRKRRATQ